MLSLIQRLFRSSKCLRTLYLGVGMVAATVAFGQSRTLDNKGELDTTVAAYHHSFAVVIGINGYPGLPDSKQLHFAENDAKEFGQVLVEYYGFEPDKVTYLLGPRATLADINKTLRGLADSKRIDKDDRVVIFFSGHGHTVKRADGTDVGFLIPEDAHIRLSETDNIATLNECCKKMSEVWSDLEDCPAKHVLLIADSCFSGLFATMGRGPTASERLMLERRAMQVIAAGGKGQKSEEKDTLQHGVFTYKLLEEMKARARAGLTFDVEELFGTLKRQVTDYTNGGQVPQMGHKDTEGSMLFVGSGSGASRAARVQKALAAFGRRDYSTSFPELKALAEEGESACYASLGRCYVRAWGTSKNAEEALRWYTKAVEIKDPKGFFGMGRLFDRGDGVSQDYAKAMEWYQKAADLGESSAMNNIGGLYALGNGVTQDYAKAMEWYRKAAGLGEPLAMNNIGILYDAGQGVPQDYAKAMEWYQKAADLGEPIAMSNIGWMYEYGHGVERDVDHAIIWYRKAAKLGNQYAKDQLKRLGKSEDGQ